MQFSLSAIVITPYARRRFVKTTMTWFYGFYEEKPMTSSLKVGQFSLAPFTKITCLANVFMSGHKLDFMATYFVCDVVATWDNGWKYFYLLCFIDLFFLRLKLYLKFFLF